jgi:hypothetical protein
MMNEFPLSHVLSVIPSRLDESLWGNHCWVICSFSSFEFTAAWQNISHWSPENWSRYLRVGTLCSHVYQNSKRPWVESWIHRWKDPHLNSDNLRRFKQSREFQSSSWSYQRFVSRNQRHYAKRIPGMAMQTQWCQCERDYPEKGVWNRLDSELHTDNIVIGVSWHRKCFC